MNENPTDQEPTEQEGLERISRQAKGLAKIANLTFSTGDREKPEPAPVITTEHRPKPEPPPRWRAPQSARQEAARLRDEAAAAAKAAEQIERDHDSKIRRLNSLNHVIGLKTQELQKTRRLLEELEPDSLGKRLEEAYWTYKSNPWDQHSVNQFLLAGNLASNSKKLRGLLEGRIAEDERSIAEAEDQVIGLEKELEAANVGSETV